MTLLFDALPVQMTMDPITGRSLPAEALQRVLYVVARAHVYQIPPMQSLKGYTAASWTDKPSIFTARVRILETALGETVTAAVLLEDPNTGDLFAAAPYISKSVVTPAIDSSRFFAIRVQGDGGMKATLGLGFEDRSEAIDFGIALEEAAKAIGLSSQNPAIGRVCPTGAAAGSGARKDFALKQGEKIAIQIGGKSRIATSSDSNVADGATIPILAPPPSAAQVKQSRGQSKDQSMPRDGFDDDFGDFQ